MCELQDQRIGRLRRKHVAQTDDLMSELSKQVAEVFGDVVIEQEFHR
jgi:hypothetical protein